MSVNFFERQDQAYAKTKLLIALFVAAVAAIVASVYVAARLLVGLATSTSMRTPQVRADDELFLVAVAGGALVIVLAGTLFKVWQLSGGGAVLAARLGGRPVLPNTEDPDERKLLNVVEEMAIASGTPVPEVYLLSDETAINAFAAGFTPSDAAIGVTRGAIEMLDRDELQGVIAHEFSHILNGDMRLNIRLMGVVHGILVIGLLGRFLCRIVAESGSRRSYGSRRRKGGGGGAAIFAAGVALFVIGYVGVFFGRLIKAAVSRQREFLADASAVQFTRNPDGIAGALRKIGGLAAGSRLVAERAEEASHIFFGNGLPPFMMFSRLFDTHPPLGERIRAIDPRFDGRFVAPVRPAAGGGGLGDEAGVSQFAGAIEAVAPDAFVDRTGEPTLDHVLYGQDLIRKLPRAIRDAVHEPFVAQAVAFALLLDSDPAARRRQLEQLRAEAAPGLDLEIVRLAPAIEKLGPAARLPLLDLALPALRQLSRAQYRAFVRQVDLLVEADPTMSVFAYALKKVCLRHLRAAHEKAAPARPAVHSVRAIADDCALVLASLARAGHAEEAEARAAFESAMKLLELPARVPALATGAAALEKLDGALDRIGKGDGGVKRRVLGACAQCVAHDRKVFVAEAELLRAIADALDCPMPPLLPSAAGSRTLADLPRPAR